MGRGRGRRGGGGEEGERVDREEGGEIGGEGGTWGGHLGFLKTPFFWKEDKSPENFGSVGGREERGRGDQMSEIRRQNEVCMFC